MLTSEQSYHSLLQSFIDKPTSQDAISVAHTCVQIAKLSNPSKPLLNLAQKALSLCSAHSSPATLPQLTSICEIDPSSLQAFVLSSAAWKTILPLAHHCKDTRIATRVILCALSSAWTIFGKSLVSGDKSQLNRCLKIIRFYCTNLNKCIVAFSKLSFDEPEIQTILTNLCPLLSFFSYVYLFDDKIFHDHSYPIQSTIIPLLLSSLKVVISNLHSKSNTNRILIFKAVVRSATYTNIYNSLTIPPEILRLLSLLHLLRCAITSSYADKQFCEAIQVLYSVYVCVLLPALFSCLDNEYVNLASLTVPSTSLMFLDTVLSSASYCLAAVELESLEEQIPSQRDYFLQKIVSSNPAHYLLANQTLRTMCSLSESKEFHDYYMAAIFACIRTSVLFEHPFTVTRWLPLAAQFAIKDIRKRRPWHAALCYSLKWTRSCPSQIDDYQISLDKFPLTVLSGLVQSGEVDDSYDADSSNVCFSTCLSMMTRESSSLLAEVRQCLRSQSDLTAEIFIHLLPMLVDTSSHMQPVLHEVLKRTNITPSMSCVALSLISTTGNLVSLEQTCEVVLRLIKEHGPCVCPYVAGFALKAIESLPNVRGCGGHLKSLLKVLDVCVHETAQTKHDVVSRVIYCSVMRHACDVGEMIQSGHLENAWSKSFPPNLTEHMKDRSCEKRILQETPNMHFNEIRTQEEKMSCHKIRKCERNKEVSEDMKRLKRNLWKLANNMYGQGKIRRDRKGLLDQMHQLQGCLDLIIKDRKVPE